MALPSTYRHQVRNNLKELVEHYFAIINDALLTVNWKDYGVCFDLDAPWHEDRYFFDYLSNIRLNPEIDGQKAIEFIVDAYKRTWDVDYIDYWLDGIPPVLRFYNPDWKMSVNEQNIRRINKQLGESGGIIGWFRRIFYGNN